MLNIDYRYYKDEKTRDEMTVRAETFAGIIIDKYILKGKTLVVGSDPILRLPDVHTDDLKFGFEVVTCEKYMDYIHTAAARRLVEIGCDKNQYFKEKKNKHSIFAKIDLDVHILGNKITSSRVKNLYHTNDWMRYELSQSLTKKLCKLNNGNYANCKNVSLCILSLCRDVGVDSADILSLELNKVYKDYKKHFRNIYLITKGYIFSIKRDSVEIIEILSEEEYLACVKILKNCLEIKE